MSGLLFGIVSASILPVLKFVGDMVSSVCCLPPSCFLLNIRVFLDAILTILKANASWVESESNGDRIIHDVQYELDRVHLDSFVKSFQSCTQLMSYKCSGGALLMKSADKSQSIIRYYEYSVWFCLFL